MQVALFTSDAGAAADVHIMYVNTAVQPVVSVNPKPCGDTVGKPRLFRGKESANCQPHFLII